MNHWSLTLKLRGVRPADPTEISEPPPPPTQPLQPGRVVPRARAFRPTRATRREGGGDGDDPPHRAAALRRLPFPARATRRGP